MSNVHAFTSESFLRLYMDDRIVYNENAPEDDPMSKADAFYFGMFDAVERKLIPEGATITGTNGDPLSVKYLGRHLTAEQRADLAEHFDLVWDEPLPEARRGIRRCR